LTNFLLLFAERLCFDDKTKPLSLPDDSVKRFFLPVDTGFGVRAAVIELPAISPPSINGTALDGPGAESLATLKKIEKYELLQKSIFFIHVEIQKLKLSKYSRLHCITAS
jgi:hypothetical protein